MPFVNPDVLKGVYGNGGADGCKNVLAFVRQGLADKKFTAEQVSIKALGIILGAIDPLNEIDSFRETCALAASTENRRPESLFTESNPGLYSNAFQIVTGELISSKVIEGYMLDEGYIGDSLVEIQTNQRVRNQRVAGFTALAGPLDVAEGHPYSESAFTEKYVTTAESKKGRILSLNEELVLFDQTGEIMRRARMLGNVVRQDRERTIVRAVIDADQCWRPSGTATALYAAGNKNYIGVGGVTGYDAAVALQDWTDLETVMTYRATKVNDDRIDGTQRPIVGLNSPRNVLLVSEKKSFTARHIVGTDVAVSLTDSDVRRANFNVNNVMSMVGGVMSSPFVDEVDADNWFYGNFKKQFLWTEIYPIQTFTQGAGSEADFERDVAMRIKVRYYGGMSATDTVYVTKVDGA